MRVLVVHPGPSWSVADVYRGWLRGLDAAGAHVQPFNLDDRLNAFESAHVKNPTTGEFVRAWPDADSVAALAGFGLLAACFQFAPQVVLVVSARMLHTEMYDCIRARGIKVVILHTESPYEDDAQLALAEHADLNLINDPTNAERFAELGPWAYVPHAYDPTVHRPGPSRFDLDVAWIGTAGNTFPGRTRFLEQVDFGDARVGLAGLWEGVEPGHPLHRHLLHPDAPATCVDNDETAELYRGSKMSFNLYRTEGDRTDGAYTTGWAMSPREVELAATGCFFARHRPDEHGGEGDQVLSMLPTFDDPAELGEIIAHYLAHDDTRARLAAEARAAVAERTFEQHARRLLEQIPTNRAAAH